MKTMMFLVGLAAIAGCATTPVPADKLARSQAMVQSAEVVQADADPRASVHLQLAREELRSAKKLMKDGDNDAASWVLMRAEADGEAALHLAQARMAKADAEQTLTAIRQAKTTMMQSQTGGQGS
jgi:hypothetical protein